MNRDIPRESEISTVGCTCDFCGCSLDKKIKIWTWNEHFGCTKDHAQKAQAITNSLTSLASFKQYVEKDTDLL